MSVAQTRTVVAIIIWWGLLVRDIYRYFGNPGGNAGECSLIAPRVVLARRSMHVSAKKSPAAIVSANA